MEARDLAVGGYGFRETLHLLGLWTCPECPQGPHLPFTEALPSLVPRTRRPAPPWGPPTAATDLSWRQAWEPEGKPGVWWCQGSG